MHPTDLVAANDAMLAGAIASAQAGAAQGEEAELYRRFAPRVRLHGLKHLRDAAAAQDLVQQVFVITIERLRRGEVRNEESIGSFILGTSRMVRRYRIGGWRSHPRRKDPDCHHRRGPEQAFTRRASRSHVHAAAGHLHPVCGLGR